MHTNTRGRSLTYQDVLLVPRYSELETRDKADTSVKFLGHKFNLPVIPANMSSVIDVDLARKLSGTGYFYIYHRFGTSAYDGTNLNTVDFTKKANNEKWPIISISTGVKEDSKKELALIHALRLRVNFITIDVAHAHHKLVKDMIWYIKHTIPKAKLIVGNVATPKAVKDLIKWGADCVKIGIGGGSICTTKLETGFSVPMFSCVQECCQDMFIDTTYTIPIAASKPCVPIIADGGIQHIGDISKALTAGAKMIMSGGLFASCSDSPAKLSADGRKIYFGSTSYEAKGNHDRVEGKAITCKVDISYFDKLNKIKQSLQSAISYAGGKDLSAFQNVEWREV